MNPLNAPERRKAFINFLLFFAITLSVILITVFFSIQVPFKENNKLRKEMDIADNERAFLQSFEVKMQETTNLVDSIIRAQNVFIVQKDIDNNIKTMTNMISDSTSVKGICTKIISNLATLRAANEQLRSSSNSNDDLEKKDKRIQQLESEAKAYADRINELYLRLGAK